MPTYLEGNQQSTIVSDHSLMKMLLYSPRQRKSQHFRSPDFFVVLDVEKKPRKSWVVWEEGGKYPNVIIEILSITTAETDRGFKKDIYQDIFRTPDYFWFDPETLEFQGFKLMEGQYQPIEPNRMVMESTIKAIFRN